ncbi:MAG: hypothetical protein IKP14_09175 [Clostridiales bacterium]|nr:hypothetical protein [Clostridiales bacterium]
MSDNNVPSEYKPISMWGYFGYELLFGIPVIGFIILLVFAFGGSGNINLKNFARSKFCYVILLFVIFVVLTAIGMATGAAQSIADMMS